MKAIIIPIILSSCLFGLLLSFLSIFHYGQVSTCFMAIMILILSVYGEKS